jgi:hypothetical protein
VYEARCMVCFVCVCEVCVCVCVYGCIDNSFRRTRRRGGKI